MFDRFKSVLKSKSVLVLSVVLCIGCLKWCYGEERKNVFVADKPDSPIVVLFDNDVHCAVEGYLKMSALKLKSLASTEFVTVVSAGDFAQGSLVGTISNGEYVADIMNSIGYDVVVMGNHEFDYGMAQMYKLMGMMQGKVVSANFRSLKDGKYPFPPYKMIQYGDVDVAYIGFTTTATMGSVSHFTFYDENGNATHDFCNDFFFENAQRQIDLARRDGADYVVAVTHLGDIKEPGIPTSLELVNKTYGIDVVLDGHSHSTIPDTLICNVNGDSVLLSSTGYNFENIGRLTLNTDGKFKAELIPVSSIEGDAEGKVVECMEYINNHISKAGEAVIGVSEYNLSIYDESENLVVRAMETAIGNLCADAFRNVLDADVAMINGGGIRADIPVGNITYNCLGKVLPYGNSACTAYMTGAQIADALELSVSYLPLENGGFMQVSGLTFDVDISVQSGIIYDEKGLFEGVADGCRRISNVRILNKSTGVFEPVDSEKKYVLAGFDYQIKELGSSGIFRYAELKEDNMGLDIDILISFIKNNLEGVIGEKYAKTEGRINIK